MQRKRRLQKAETTIHLRRRKEEWEIWSGKLGCRCARGSLGIEICVPFHLALHRLDHASRLVHARRLLSIGLYAPTSKALSPFAEQRIVIDWLGNFRSWLFATHDRVPRDILHGLVASFGADLTGSSSVSPAPKTSYVRPRMYTVHLAAVYTRGLNASFTS